MNKYEIELKDRPSVIIEGDRYICDVDLVSVLKVKDEQVELIATYHNWTSIRLVKAKSK